MKKIVVGGQMGKEEIEGDLHKLIHENRVQIEILGDLDAAMAVQNHQADYYVGACATGAGGALAMVTALLGSEKAITVASPTKVMSLEEIKKEVNDGKIAFGFTFNAKNTVLPEIVEALKL